MRLPKWLWRLIRSKRFHRFLVLAPFVAIVGVVIFYWGMNQWGRAKLDATREKMRELGIPLTAAEREAFLPERRHELHDRTAFDGLTERDTRGWMIGSPRLPRWSDWMKCLDGGPGYPAGDLRLLYRRPTGLKTQKDLADRLLTTLEPARSKLEPVVRIINDPSHPLLFDGIEEWSSEYRMTFGASSPLPLHSFLLAKSGDLEQAISEYLTVARLIEKWQHPPHPRTVGASYMLLYQLNLTTPLLIEAVRDHPQHLEAIDAALAAIDTLQPALRAEEIRLGECCERFSQQVVATNLPASEMDWSCMGGFGWEYWTSTLGEWWWQVQPAGFKQANLASDVDSLLPLLRRSAETLPDAWVNYASLYNFKLRTDWRTDGFHVGYSDNTTIAELGYPMWALLDLNFNRLAIAAERHRHRTGSYPEDIEGLLPEPPVSPFTGNPVRLDLLPDGRLSFQADGISAGPSGIIHFDPDHPERVVFEYPSKP